MPDVNLIDIRQEIFSDNNNCAADIRDYLKFKNTKMINIMGSPGCGKTTFLLRTIQETKAKRKIAVIEADLDSMIDSDKIVGAGAKAVQINTGNGCHLDAVVVQRALESFPVENFDVVFVENIGNLVCPAEFDIGENLKVMILSVPEGDDKILKYPLMFSVADVLIISKIDYLPDDGFSVENLRARAAVLNPSLKLFELSAKTGAGSAAWISYLENFLVADHK